MQILAFDFGTQYIGVAVGQTVTKTSSPLVVLKVDREEKEIWNSISDLIEEWKPDQILVGKPLNMDGTPSEIMKKIEAEPKKYADEYLNRLQDTLVEKVIEIDRDFVQSFRASMITQLFSKKKNQIISREEISAMANLGYDEGVFTKDENRIIQNIINLKKIKVTEILTPRVVVISADENLKIEDFKTQKHFFNFSRIPIFSDQNEKITGYILLQEILKTNNDKKKSSPKLKDFKRDILTVPNTINLFVLFNRLVEKKEHISIVVDEYGGLEGIITMEDVIEAFLGLEIMDESDQVIDMQKYAKQKWLNKKNN